MVSHETLRSGRPYTLVLVKTRALFEREAKAQAELRAGLAWLEAQRATLRPGEGAPRRTSKQSRRSKR